MIDFALETKLKNSSPELYKRMNDTRVVMHEMLYKFRYWFPTFTDHSNLHSMNVLEYCNALIGSNIEKLSAEECYVLIMSCYLHDIGMDITPKDYEEFCNNTPIYDYLIDHQGEEAESIIRKFHNELSAMVVEKYADIFEIPSKELLFAIKQVCRGHRKTDLYDQKEYPRLTVDRRNINTAYLAAIIRLADEIDVGALRNFDILFDSKSVTLQKDIDAFGTHDSIRDVIVEPGRIILKIRPIEPRFIALIDELGSKLQETLDYCKKLVLERSDYEISQKTVIIEEEDD